ncbi:hypothetical protein SPRG_04030 [Saprolegnia parasitica CBS 223.65]|uniref:3'-5' exonuclease domain-containing protein n=1 Tax=Saprolegnia parasitica (strain CBS 223.65) TaxID=695850 RepID=A0A067CQ86_SAPPC|nr:hypothetical protein SPRG_04030 [Saprolegnia parasitica CBS 223.65]KDO31415.1 hypothetical protein SPRG_04030 [Saprolegnia parasitica CBS 223.65]|eukprot:XP_012198010.1 hypothetical protein SPRG_04030 [Saprolegnia parasitica CBS 223.65]
MSTTDAPTDATPTLAELQQSHPGASLDLVPLFTSRSVHEIAARVDFLLRSSQRMLLHEELPRACGSVTSVDALEIFLLFLEHQATKHPTALSVTMSLLPLLPTAELMPSSVQEAATRFFQKHLPIKATNTSMTGLFCALYHVPMPLRVDTFNAWLRLDSVAALKFLEAADVAAHVDLDATLRLLVEKTHFNAADRLAVHVPSLQRAYVQALVDTYADAKVTKKRITRFNFLPDDFPEFVARRRRATIKYLVKAGQYGDVDQAVGGDASAMKFACRCAYDTCGADSDVTRQFVQQYNLGSLFPDVVASQDAGDLSLLMDDPPRLDGFASILTYLPSSHVCFLASPVDVAGVVKDLLSAPFVGLDCEWRASYNSFTSTGSAGNPCALLQLATSTHVYLVDMLVPGMLEPLAPWLASPSSLKLGFDIKSDLAALQAPVVCGVVDLQTVAKKTSLLPSNRPSLSDLALNYLGLPLDKRVRMSNWERRPLTAMQCEYAALDAYVLVAAYAAAISAPSVAAAVAHCRYDASSDTN